MNGNRIYWFVLLVAIFICGAVFSPAIESLLLQSRHLESIAKSCFALVCHQEPARSYHIAGICLPVCARCTGLYTGFLAAWGLWRMVPEKRRNRPVSNVVLFTGIFPLCLDGVLNLAHIVNTPAHIRLITGFMFGAVAARSLWPALLETATIVKSLLGKKPACNNKVHLPPTSETHSNLITGEKYWKGHYTRERY